MVRTYYSLIHTNMTCQPKSNSADVAIQTVIRVFPHILEGQLTARISSDKKVQTEIATKPDDKNEKFYSMLRFTPYQDIQEDSMRIIDLPRQVRLQFIPGVEFDKMAEIAKQFSLADDDGVGYICSELIHRFERRQKPCLVDASVQTDLKVHPHLLKNEHVATVVISTSLQTDACLIDIQQQPALEEEQIYEL